MVFGQLTGIFQRYFQGNSTKAQFSHDLSHFTLYFIYLAVGEFVTIYIATSGWIYAGENIAQKIREQYLAAILRQNIGFFDKLGAGEITTRITSDTNLVQDGISQKVGLTMTAITTFLTAFVVGFVKSWKLTLIMTSTVISIVLLMGIGSRFIIKYSKKSLEAYGAGGSVVEEVVSSIRNATAFGTQDKLARLYDTHLAEAEKSGIRTRTALSIMIACMFGVVNLSYVSRSLVDLAVGQSILANIASPGARVLARISIPGQGPGPIIRYPYHYPRRHHRCLPAGQCCPQHSSLDYKCRGWGEDLHDHRPQVSPRSDCEGGRSARGRSRRR